MTDDYIYEELTFLEFSERFLLNNDVTTPDVYDIEYMGIEILTLDKNNNEVYKPMTSFVVKPTSENHYTDSIIKVTAEHKFVENGIEILAKEHPDFHLVEEPIQVVDCEVEDEHTYLANGRLNHNTTSGGKALGFHSSVRLRLKSIGQIKAKIHGVDAIIGVKTEAKVIKNRVGPPFRKTEFDIYFDSGIDDLNGWINKLKDYDIVTVGGAWYTYTDQETGEITKFQLKQLPDMFEKNPDLKESMYNAICDKMIMKYNSNEIPEEDKEFSDESLDIHD